MAKPTPELSLPKLSKTVNEARMAKGWTLEQLSHELWERGFPTAQNKLWRLENRPPKRIDTELLLFLEKVLEVELIESGEKNQVLIEDVVELLDHFVAGEVPEQPSNSSLQPIYERLLLLQRPPG
ncbi:MAG: helix-turn-helix domain-containing protein [Verrucomicrobiales bacterium]